MCLPKHQKTHARLPFPNDHFDKRVLRASLRGVGAVMALFLFPPDPSTTGTVGFLWLSSWEHRPVYLTIKDPKLLEQRMNVARGGKKPAQKIIMFFAMTGFIVLFLFLPYSIILRMVLGGTIDPWQPPPPHIRIFSNLSSAQGKYLPASTIQIADRQLFRRHLTRSCSM